MSLVGAVPGQPADARKDPCVPTERGSAWTEQGRGDYSHAVAIGIIAVV